MTNLDVAERPRDDSIEADPEVAQEPDTTAQRWSPRWIRTAAYLVLPVAVLAMAAGAGYLKWQASSLATTQAAGTKSVSAATETVTAMLSYRAEQVDRDLTPASELMTGEFRDEYTTLINDVVIPGAQQGGISAEATVPAAALVSATQDRAEVLVYINQTTTVGADPPTDSMSSARVLLEKVNDQWLISGFDPI